MDDVVCSVELTKSARTHIVVRSTHGAMDHEYKAQLVDLVGFGSGNTTVEAIRSIAKRLRDVAAEIEEITEKQ